MVKEGYKCTSADHIIYTCTTNLSTSIVATHVNDMLATASTTSKMAHLKLDLWKYFKLVDLGPVHWLLGMNIEQDRDKHTISMLQTVYIDTITEQFNLMDSHCVLMPMDPNSILTKAMSPSTDSKKQQMKNILYLTAVGSIMYVAIGTRPDVILMPL